jgi:hypothetical protein
LPGAVVTLTERPGTNSAFGSWGGACVGAGSSESCTVVVNDALSVDATFVRQRYGVSVARGGTGGGVVTSAPGAIDCGAVCAAVFDAGTTVTLAARPDSGSDFGGWTGACGGALSTCTLAIDAAKTVGATFTKSIPPTPRYGLTVSKRGAGSGVVAGNGISCGATCAATYDGGTQVTLSAVAAAGSRFVGWAGACTGGGSCTVTIDAATVLIAEFAKVKAPPARTTICYRHRTMKVPKAQLKQYLRRGAKRGACKSR